MLIRMTREKIHSSKGHKKNAYIHDTGEGALVKKTQKTLIYTIQEQMHSSKRHKKNAHIHNTGENALIKKTQKNAVISNKNLLYLQSLYHIFFKK